MPLRDTIAEVDRLDRLIRKHGPLGAELLKKVNYKFRLEWNYYSNSMEGNTLTLPETRTVMVGNITVDGKPIRDVMEMKGHDDVISTILQLGKGDLNISEKRIKEIHAGILYEEDPEKRKLIGTWKTAPNYIYNYKNERFDFADWREVPERMHHLVDWLAAENNKIKRGDNDALHPVLLAFKFHLDYITIHPFYDGNGRTSRILTNLILISHGYQPVYVKTKEREIYYQYLADIQGYGGEPDLFYTFMAGLLLRSERIVLDAIEGKDIEEMDDLIKDISLWRTQLESNTFESRSLARSKQLYYDSLSPLLDLYRKNIHEAFASLFASWHEIGVVNGRIRKEAGKEFIDASIRDAKPDAEPVQLMLKMEMRGFTKDKTNTFSYFHEVGVDLDEFKYIVRSGQQTVVEKLYVEAIDGDERISIVKEIIRNIWKQIRLNMRNPSISDLTEDT
jgi:Fic family protein